MSLCERQSNDALQKSVIRDGADIKFFDLALYFGITGHRSKEHFQSEQCCSLNFTRMATQIFLYG